MILLPVDYGYAFDVLSIALVKVQKKILNSENWYEKISKSISDQIGENLFNLIMSSKEFENLHISNLKTFDCVEKARYESNSISAKEVDDCNMERYYCKVNLQKKFFPETLILENKS